MTKEEKEQLAAIGHEEVETPDGQIEAVVEETEPESVQEEVDEKNPEQVQVEEAEEEEVDEEAQRRSWQSEADKAKAEAEKLRQEAELIRQQNAQLMQTLTTVTGKQEQTKQEATVDKEPELTDFITPDQFDKYDANDPATPSGQAMIKFNRALARHEAKQAYAQERRQENERKQQTILQQQAEQLANDYPEKFRDAFGRINMPKVIEFIDGFSNSEDPKLFSNLYALQNGKQVVPSSSGLGRRAGRVKSTAESSSEEKTRKPVPKTFQKMNEYFGDFEYPEDGEFE